MSCCLVMNMLDSMCVPDLSLYLSLYLSHTQAGNEGGVSRIELLFKFARYLVSQEVLYFIYINVIFMLSFCSVFSQRHKAATEILQKIYWTHSYIEEHEKVYYTYIRTVAYHACARMI